MKRLSAADQRHNFHLVAVFEHLLDMIRAGHDAAVHLGPAEYRGSSCSAVNKSRTVAP